MIHEGVDGELLKPDPSVKFKLPSGVVLGQGDEVVTYVARNLEPYRGFPTLMKAVAVIAKQRPNCHFIIVGGDGVSYGAAPKNASCWREQLLKEVDIDTSRVHFLGRVPYDQYRKILQVSSVHFYLTYPFVLSWSMLEAMATGCLVMASATAPVQEVITDGVNGLLVDFFDHEEWAKRAIFVLAHLDDYRNIRTKARETVLRHYSQKTGLNRYLQLFEEVLG